MERRFVIFCVLVFALFAINQMVWRWIRPPVPQAKVAQNEPKKDQPAAAGKAAEANKPAKPADDQPAKPEEAEAEPSQADVAPQWVALGSADPDDPYRMLVTLTNRGAAVERVEFSSRRYRHLEDESGYLGYVAATNAPKASGAVVNVVGPGTPAAKAGLKAGDVITATNGKKVRNALDLRRALEDTRPGQSIEVTIERDEKQLVLPVELARRPLDVIRPEHNTEPLDVVAPTKAHDPLSLEMTLQQVGERVLPDNQAELKGLDLRNGNWEVIKSSPAEAVFRKVLPKYDLEVIKRYNLARVPQNQTDDEIAPAYHLKFAVEVRNTGEEAQNVAYRLIGPSGLPIEGAWYASKVSRSSSAALRDVSVRFLGGEITEIGGISILDGEGETWRDSPLIYAAVDAQYFTAALLPEKAKLDEVWFSEVKTVPLGKVDEKNGEKRLANVSFQLQTQPAELAAGQALQHEYTFFVGPKKPDLLAQYGPPEATLRELVYYGWFWWVARPMLAVLHFFYAIVGNYSLAIIMLTVLVRSCMFPLSRKQALSAQKMQELQPEIKRINEKYKKNAEQRTKAQQELFRKHNYNPLGGCLLAFVQLPIFIGLYRSLMVDVELRQAPLLSESIRWASNLGAPDMLLNWEGFMPQFITAGTGIFGLGPYLNILPLVTVALFIWQQKMFMPPPADEQAALQQKMMQYMMIFMGVLFYKVASGLCLYFIASSIWGIAERKLLPKTTAKTEGETPQPVQVAAASSPGGNGSPKGKKQQRERK